MQPDEVVRYVELAIGLLTSLYVLVSCVVALTPTTKDDDALQRTIQRLSFLAPKNVPGLFSMPGRRERGE
jgi:hypothetical protein